MALTSSDIQALIDDAHRGEDGVRSVPDDHLFMNQADAMETAREMGLDGVHMMRIDGDQFYVPGSTRTAYLMATVDVDHDMLASLSVYEA
jgi:hypothetical protein